MRPVSSNCLSLFLFSFIRIHCAVLIGTTFHLASAQYVVVVVARMNASILNTATRRMALYLLNMLWI
jgi:hypothetical protein